MKKQKTQKKQNKIKKSVRQDQTKCIKNFVYLPSPRSFARCAGSWDNAISPCQQPIACSHWSSFRTSKASQFPRFHAGHGQAKITWWPVCFAWWHFQHWSESVWSLAILIAGLQRGVIRSGEKKCIGYAYTIRVRILTSTSIVLIHGPPNAYTLSPTYTMLFLCAI